MSAATGNPAVPANQATPAKQASLVKQAKKVTKASNGSQGQAATGQQNPAAQPTTPRPEATIQKMILCLPDSLPSEVLTSDYLSQHYGVTGSPTSHFWAVHNLGRRQRRQMFGLYPTGVPARCTGGPRQLLDINGLRLAAGAAAGFRHEQWRAAVRGTKPARPWVSFHTMHLASPDTYTYQQAQHDFFAQPRVIAMRMRNANNPTGTELRLKDLEAFEAGPGFYQDFCALSAVCADALMTPDLRIFKPASDAQADRFAYLERAFPFLHNAAPSLRLFAISVSM